jgi:iron(II)-dependent oxidoreductase
MSLRGQRSALHQMLRTFLPEKYAHFFGACTAAAPGWLAVLLAAGIVFAGEPVTDNPLVEIPAGPFVFGNDEGAENQRPRRIMAGRAFAIHRTEISNAQYRAFVAATGHRRAFYDGHPGLGLDARPVVGVSFHDAAAFCDHYGLRLPSEQEYERAARGPEGAPYPWGNAPPTAMLVNGGSAICCSGDDRDGYAMTAPVDSFPSGASKEGVLNLVGNVWEWTRDVYAPYTAEAKLEDAAGYRVLRGGSWNSDAARLSATYRLAYASEFRFAANGGFRCVRSSG